MSTAYTVHTSVESIKRVPDEPGGIFYVHFAGSRESIGLGDEPPEFEVGDRIKITFTKEKADAT